MSKVFTVFAFSDYKKFFNAWVDLQPKQGYGEYRRVAQALGLSTTMVSQVFKADKHLSMEMAADLCDYLGLNEDEADYLLLMVEFQKAGSFKLKSKLERQMKKSQEKSAKLESKIKKDIELSEQDKGVYYSSWLYQATRLLSDIEAYNDADEISQRLNVPKNQILKVIQFLVETNLCKREKGKLKMGPAITHLAAGSPIVTRHHLNWRVRGYQQMTLPEEKNLFATIPMVLSESLADKIRQELPQFVQNILAEVAPSPSETVRCLNIDYFEF
jgi:uncharacterized protein (TIGR02147 family)